MDPALWELLRRGDHREEEIEAIIRLDQPQARVEGVRIITRFGPIATCRLKRENIIEVREEENVRSLKATRVFAPEREAVDTDETLPLVVVQGDIRRPQELAFTGAGVVIGIVDWGCDFHHPNFKRDGSTRILALWDQRYSLRGGQNRYGYGTIHTREQIDRALQTDDPYGALGYHPAAADPAGTGAHGTHVMDIAAGNGRCGGPVGVAPEADLIFVHLANKGTSGLANLGDSVRILEAVDFVARVAGGRPWVINLSVGRHGGPHDGTSLCELAFDYLLSAAPNRFICQSTGNYFDRSTHACGCLHDGEERTLSMMVDQADYTPNELEIWYSGKDEFAIRAESPTGTLSPWVGLGEDADLLENGQVVGRLYNRAFDPNNADHQIDGFLYSSAPPGLWRVTIRAVKIVDGSFHAWLERDDACFECQTRFVEADADRFYTTGTLANSRFPLVVGAYDKHSPSREIAPFSSAGPTRDNRPKPDLVAPGYKVLAARSAPRGWPSNPGLLIRKSGTSMATPHITGTVALCLQAAQRPLWSHEIRALILNQAEPAAGGQPTSLRYGRGYLNIPAAVQVASNLSSSAIVPLSSEPTGVEESGPHPTEDKMKSYLYTEYFDLLDQAIMEPASRAASERNLLAQILRANGLPFEPRAVDPDRLYRELVFGRSEGRAKSIAEHFIVLARPGELPQSPPRKGDLLLRVSPGHLGLGHVAVIADSTLWPDEQLSNAPFGAERQEPGYYVVVSEAGACPHPRSKPFARRILDKLERMLPRQILMRLRPSDGPTAVDKEFSWNVSEEEASFEYDNSPQAQTPQPTVVSDLAVAPFATSLRTKLYNLLTPNKNQEALAWNAAQHSSKSGVEPQLILDKLKDYVDLPTIENAIHQFNAANPSTPIDLTANVVNSVFVEAVHQFQQKCFTDKGRKGENWDGKAGSKVLHSLGIIQPKGKNPLAEVNSTSKSTIEEKDITGQIGSTVIDHRNWFDFIVNPSIFGWTTDKDPGIHYELAKRLRIAENVLLAMPAYKNLTPAELGTALGITEVHKGYRRKRTNNSYHNFGLGIDISYDANPWVRGTKILEIIQHASLLHGRSVSDMTSAGYAQKYLSSLSRKYSTDQIHDILRQHHEDFIEYLSHANSLPKIRALLSSSASAGVLKAGESVDAAAARWQREIRGHVKDMRGDAGGITFDRNNGTRRDFQKGFFSHKKELVVTLRDKACLAWGAVDLGPSPGGSGDIMHFDLRSIDPFSRITDTAKFHPCRSGNMGQTTSPSQHSEVETEQTTAPVGWRDASPGGTSDIVTPPDPAGWNKYKWWVGGVLRIPLEGLKVGYQDTNQLPDWTNEAANGKAIVLIPKAVDLMKPLEVLLYFHGYSIGYRQASRSFDSRGGHWEVGWVEDIELDQIAQQIEASGRPIVAVLPQGSDRSRFGSRPFPSKIYLNEVFHALVNTKVWKQVPNIQRVILTGHSGGGDRLVELLGDLPTYHFPPAIFLFDGINAWKKDPDAARKMYWKWLKGHLDSELTLLKSQSSNDQLSHVANGLQWLAFYSDGYKGTHEPLGRDLDKWFVNHEKDLGGISSPPYKRMRANYQVIPVGHKKHFLVGLPMKGTVSDRPLLNALNSLPVVSAGSTHSPSTPTTRRPPGSAFMSETDDEHGGHEDWNENVLDLETNFEYENSGSSTTVGSDVSYQNKIFTVESADARLRNEDLNPRKFESGDILPSGKKIGDYVTLPQGAQVKISSMKTDSNNKVFALVYDAATGSAASPLGWTSSENFKGKLHNETFGLEAAVYIVEPAVRTDFFTVGDHEALVRKGSPGYARDKTKGKLTQGSFVAVVEESKDTTPQGKYVKVMSLKKSGNTFVTDKDLGWTAKNNLVPGLADFKGPNAAWESSDYLKQIDLLAIVAVRGKKEKIARDVYPAYIQTVQAAAVDGIEIILEDGFRRYSDQEKLYRLSKQGTGNPAFAPGRSYHQNGIAFDLVVQHTSNKGVGTGDVYDWLKKNATSYGFVRTVPREAWHWEYRPALAELLKKQGKYKSWELSKGENEDFSDEAFVDDLNLESDFEDEYESENFDVAAEMSFEDFEDLEMESDLEQDGPAFMHVDILHDNLQRQIGDEEIIGLESGQNLNIEIGVSANDAANRDSIRVKLVVRTPNKPAEEIFTRALQVPKIGTDPQDSTNVIYRLSVPLKDIGKILAVLDGVKEVATIRRMGGTSDLYLTRALGSTWKLRGQAEQADRCGISSGSLADERPDALKLFQAGGVATLELKDSSNKVRIKRFIRNPADIFYYTGHGTGLGFSRGAGATPPMNCLAIEDHASPYGYCCWAEPNDIIPYWRSPMDLDALIIAGCSVLAVDASQRPISGDGLEWAKLLQVKGGPLKYLVGYGDWDANEDNGQGPMGATAPKDSGGGNTIASEIGTWIKKNPSLNGIIRKWLTVNMSHQNPFGVGFDKDGYCWRTRRKSTPGWKTEERLKTKDQIRYVIEKLRII